LPNEGNDLVPETYANNKHWSTVLKIKDGEKLCKYCIGSFNKIEYNYPMMEKEILTAIRGIEKSSIFLASKSFLIQTDCKEKPSFIKMNLSNMQAQDRLLHWQLWLSQFSFSIEHIQRPKNSLQIV